MNTQHPEWIWLDACQEIGLEELARASGLSPSELAELVDYGALASMPGAGGRTCFAADWVHPLREAARIRALFDLDLFTAGLLTGYLHRIESLEQQVRALRCRLPAAPASPREGPAQWHEPHH